MVEGQFDFSGRGNLTQFIELAGKAGLFVDVRIGPYVCAGLLTCFKISIRLNRLSLEKNGQMDALSANVHLIAHLC